MATVVLTGCGLALALPAGFLLSALAVYLAVLKGFFAS